MIFARKSSNKFLILMGFLTLLIILLLYKVIKQNPYSVIFIVIFSAPLVFLISLLYMPLISRYTTWRRGAKGEELVARYLNELGSDYLIMHDVKLSKKSGNIDHIVIGKNGVFAIETKSHRGLILCYDDTWVHNKLGRAGTWYEGKIGNPSKQVKRNALELKRFLQKNLPELSTLWINAVVVFTNKDVHIEATNPSVAVLRVDQLVDFIKSKKATSNISKATLAQLEKLFSLPIKD